MSGMRINKSKFNWKTITLLLSSVLLIIIAISFMTLPNYSSRFEDYQRDELENLKNEISIVLNESDDISLSLIDLSNEYDFDIIVYDSEVLMYSSNKMYDIELVNDIYQNGYFYKGVYEQDGYVVWLVMYASNLSEFFNQVIFENLLIIASLLIFMLLILTILFRKISKPLKRVSEIIYQLRTKGELVEFQDELDEVSDSLINLTNDFSVRIYTTESVKGELERRLEKHDDLLKEQKNYLADVVHGVKSTLSSINFLSFYLNRKLELKDTEKETLDNIEKSSDKALDFITESLNNIIEDNYDIYIEKSEVDLKQLVEDYLEVNNTLLTKKRLKVELLGDNILVYNNALKLNQIVINLLSNMIKYASEDSNLKIELKDNECIFINDTNLEEVKYSNGYGLNRIKDLTNELKIGFTYQEENGIFKTVLKFGDN